jgi:hypothetical protein
MADSWTRWQQEASGTSPLPPVGAVLAAGALAYLLALSLAAAPKPASAPAGRVADTPVCAESARLVRVHAPRDETFRRLAELCRTSRLEGAAP